MIDRKQLQEAFKPLRTAVILAVGRARREGKEPTIICLGYKQLDALEDYLLSIGIYPTKPLHFRGLRIVAMHDEDSLAVYEERKGCWC